MAINRSRRFASPSLPISFPPFRGAVKWLIIVNVVVYFLVALLAYADPPVAGWINDVFDLTPFLVMHGWVWQIVTYGFLHAGLGHIFWNMLTLWFIGAWLEQDWGWKRTLELYSLSLVGAALVTIGLSYTRVFHLSPTTPTLGASGAIFGVLIAFGMIYGDQEMLMFPLPFTIKAKYIVAVWILLTLGGLLSGPGGIAYVAHLGGLFVGYAYVKWGPRHTFASSFSDSWYGARNGYYRWKRRRAARKFQVYMRKQGQTQTYFFDEYGNYRGPGTEPPSKDDKSGPKRPWVN
jgi:membrane associated rhomboid family serine protease